MRENADKGGEGVKKSEKFEDVIKGMPRLPPPSGGKLPPLPLPLLWPPCCLLDCGLDGWIDGGIGLGGERDGKREREERRAIAAVQREDRIHIWLAPSIPPPAVGGVLGR